jgi:hypothetical protein
MALEGYLLFKRLFFFAMTPLASPDRPPKREHAEPFL